MMILNWLTGKSDSAIYVQQAKDTLNKSLESLQQKEKVYMEEAAIQLEKARKHCQENNKEDAMFCLKIKRLRQHSAQVCRNLQIPVQEQLELAELVEKEVIEANKDHTTKQTTHVFIYFCLLLLLLTYFVSF